MKIAPFLACFGLLFSGHHALSQSFTDDFDGGDVDDRWLIQSNTVGTTEISQEDGHGVATTTGTNSNGGFVSIAAFDPLADGIYVSFVISEIIGGPNANGFFVGVIDENSVDGERVFHRSTNNFGIAAFGQEARTFSSDGFSLIVGDQNGSNESDIILDEGDAVDLESFNDGFSVILSADETGWAYTIEGLQDIDGADQVYENTGTWADAGTTFQEVFGQDDTWHVVTANQSPGEKITRFDQITLGDPKPASDPDVRITSKVSLGQLPAFPVVHEGVVPIRNAGEANALVISGVEVGGADADHFSVSADQLPLTIAPGETGELTFAIDNLGETGGFLGVLTLITNDPAPEEDGQVDVAVTASVIDLRGPRAHYSLDEMDGTQMRDVTGFDRNGSFGEGVVLGVDGLVEGEGGSAIMVSGGASASVNGRAFEEGTFDTFSVSLWFKPEALDGIGTLFANGLLGGNPAFALLVAEGELSWFVEETLEFSAASLEAGETYHVVVTSSPDHVGFFLNGEEGADEESPAFFEIDAEAPFHIGSFGALGFNGVIDDVRIYQRVLEEQEIEALFEPGDGGDPPPPPDSDADRLSDEDEVNIHGTDPLNPDTDGDGLNDGDEVLDFESDPLALDTDDGGTWDGSEVARGTDPNDAADDPAVWSVRTLKSRTTLTNVTDVAAMVADAGFADEILRQHDFINFLGTGNAGNFEEDLPFDNIEEIEATNLDDFAVVATTTIFIEEAGLYTFGFNSDDGAQLKVGDVTVALFSTTRGAGDSLGTVNLAPGFHEVEVHYFERGGGSELEVFWDPEPGDSSDSFRSGQHELLLPAAVRPEDSDGDELDDHWERAVFGDLAQDGTGDADADGLTDLKEHDARTDPQSQDSDGDGVDDGPEVNEHQSNPLLVDSDEDGLTDGDEVNGDPATDPTNADTDGDTHRDGFELAQGSNPVDPNDFPDDPLPQPDETWHLLGPQPTFNNFRGSDDRKDVTFRLFVDFRATDATEDEREMLWESGGGTVGFSLVYEAGNRLVLRGVGNGGNSVATVEHVLTADQLAAGPLSVIWTFDVENDDPDTGQTIALYIENQLVGEDRQDMDPDWTGSNGAAFGVASTAFAAGGDNTSLNNGVDFRSGTIDLDSGLQFFVDRVFEGGGDPPPPPIELPSVAAIVKAEAKVELHLSGVAGTAFAVEYSNGLRADQWESISSAVIGGDGTAVVEDADAARVAGAQGYYRLAQP